MGQCKKFPFDKKSCASCKDCSFDLMSLVFTVVVMFWSLYVSTKLQNASDDL